MKDYKDLCQKLALDGWVDVEGYEGRKQDRIVIWMNTKTYEEIAVHIDSDHKFVYKIYKEDKECIPAS